MKTKTNKTALIPKLRFPEFKDSGAWEVKRLGEVFTFISTKSYSRDQLNYENGIIKNIHYGDIHTKFKSLFDVTKESVPFLNSEVIQKSKINDEQYCREGDLIFADASEDLNDIGKCIEIINTNDEKIVAGLHTLHARQKEKFLTLKFGAYLFQSSLTRGQIQRESQGAKVLGISASRMKKIMAGNNAEFIEIKVLPSASTIASTSDGQYYIRIADNCKPVLPHELSRLFTDKSAFQWETKVVSKYNWNTCDQNKLKQFLTDIQNSQRVSDFVKQKSEEELLTYYQFIDSNGYLTNLGVLWLGTQQQRARLLYAPVVQFIKYNERGEKVRKEVWDDFTLNPKELIGSIWHSLPEWKEGIEISEGILGRHIVYHYNETVVRELLANALVHRPYTTRGDIFINLYPDKLEIHNPGLLPLGVTPQNILHQSVKRNEHLSKVFYDLGLMEREGSGYDKIYEMQVSEAKPLPEVQEGNDRVSVTIYNQIKNPDVIRFIEEVKKTISSYSKRNYLFGYYSSTAIHIGY
ncbi:MAG: hypothetical protein KatS3mg028_1570 [Bacteroidia bacterium]|nr:MAG: hypothetical protein KatS3mg028_1570 [Bacteroidia bacterium]